VNFIDTGVILHTRPYGETHAVTQIFTERHGRCAGLVHGGQGRRMGPILQAGNEVKAEWKGRDESLGHFALEMVRARASEAMQDRFSIAGLTAACAVAHVCLPEREIHRPSFRAMSVLLDHLGDLDLWPVLMARWELGLLGELGFGLTLDRCAATGARDDLVYVSPRSACAVSAGAGAPYKDKLLPLPSFLLGRSMKASLADALDALSTTGHFIETRILHPSDKVLPEARIRVVGLLQSALLKSQ
jgi:DNA repair protein RecO (recombination protein O)